MNRRFSAFRFSTQRWGIIEIDRRYSSCGKLRKPTEGRVIVPVSPQYAAINREQRLRCESSLPKLLLRRISLSFERLSNLEVSPWMKWLCQCYRVLWLAVYKKDRLDSRQLRRGKRCDIVIPRSSSRTIYGEDARCSRKPSKVRNVPLENISHDLCPTWRECASGILFTDCFRAKRIDYLDS